MSKDDTYTQDETDARREAALCYTLTSPLKLHEVMRKGQAESRKKGWLRLRDVPIWRGTT